MNLSDTTLIDFLELQGVKGNGWTARYSSTGRGYRLHQPGPYKTAREAIAAEIDNDATGER